MPDDRSKIILKAAPTASADWRRPLRAGLVVGVLGFGGFVGWAIAAPLDSAVIASAVVAVEGSRQVVQHLEGGIIKEIHVRNGQRVSKGDTLFVLDDTSQRASLAALVTEQATLRAREARLLAERNLFGFLAFPEELTADPAPAVKEALEDEVASFKRRRELRRAQDDVLVNKQETFRQELDGLAAEKLSSEQQRDQIDRELPGLRGLLKRGLTSLSRVTTLERERSQLVSTIARSTTDSAKAQRAIGDVDLQIEQARADWQNGVATDLIEARRQITDLGERIKIAEDVLKRLNVLAPQTGIAQARRPSTIGAVIRPGDDLVEIAPSEENLVINAKIMPGDIDVIALDQAAEIRFPNFKAGDEPMLLGSVKALSNDRVIDPQDPRQQYFDARIEIDWKDVPKIFGDKVRAGMTAEVIFPTGERSAAQYLLQPLTDRLRTAFRER